MKSIRDAKTSVKVVVHYPSQLARSPEIGHGELEHTSFDAFDCDCGREAESEMTVACAVCPLRNELKM